MDATSPKYRSEGNQHQMQKKRTYKKAPMKAVVIQP